MDKRILKISLTAALAGFLFGFDTIVISGADLPIQKLWNTSPSFHGLFIMSMALWGTVLGSIFGGIPCDRLGRKKTLFLVLWFKWLHTVWEITGWRSGETFLLLFVTWLRGIRQNDAWVWCNCFTLRRFKDCIKHQNSPQHYVNHLNEINPQYRLIFFSLFGS